MEISPLTLQEFPDFLALVDEQIRPEGSVTHAWEDFPVVLDPANRGMTLGLRESGQLAAGIACLVRQFQTSCGPIPVAGISSVVTRPGFRGRGFSRTLQKALIKRLEGANVPLAVLWTDRPEFYTGRGFRAAGWEFHVDMMEMSGSGKLPGEFICREFRAEDSLSVADLYQHHLLRTVRLSGDSARLYTMPGTRGLVAVGEGGQVSASVFCGKGGDFQGHVAEWNGPVGLVLPLLDEVRSRGWARHVLVPPGGEALAAQLVQAGARAVARTSGWWLVIQPAKLSRYLQGAGKGAARDPADPTAILGTVGTDGVVRTGALTLAVWGFDSV